MTKIKKALSRVLIVFPQGISAISLSRLSAPGRGTSGTSTQQLIGAEQYEEQRKRLNANWVEEAERMFVQFRQERLRMIEEFAARLLNVGRQAEQ